MPELYHARAHIKDLHREAAAQSLARSVAVKPKPVPQRPAFAAAEVEVHEAVAYPAVTAAIL